MDLFFMGFNSGTPNPVTISPFAAFTYLMVCIWLGLLLTRPEK
jgi:hypothetical protein